ncbi:TonB-dependent receptor [Algoriphagus namhaensis]
MKTISQTLICTVFASLLASASLAQTQSRGEVTDQEFVIRKDRVLTLPTQPRAFEKLPVLPQPKGISDFDYTFNRYSLQLKPVALDATPAQKVYRKDRRDLYPGYIKAGYGNFASPLLEARYMATEVDQFNYSVHLGHQSFGEGPIAGEQSKESHTQAGFDGSYFTDLIEIFGGLNWRQDGYSFYGVDSARFEDPDFLTADNVFSTFSVFGGIRDVEKVGPISYEAKIGFRTFQDSYLAAENEFSFRGKGKYRVNEDWSVNLGLSYFATTPENVDYQENRNYLAIRPSVSYRYEDFTFEAGVNIISENDSIEGKSNDFRIFPKLKAQYQFADEFGFFAEFSGDVHRQTYLNFVRENPFLGPNDRLLNTVNNYHVEAGIEGQFNEVFNYRGAINLDRFNQLHFFVNSSPDASRFDIVYDDKSTVVTVEGELGLKLSETYRLASNLKLYQYSLNQLEEAWHRPVWELGINNQLKPVDRLLIQANLNFMGGIRAPLTPVQEGVATPFTTLKTIADIQLMADFGITDRLSVFAQGNNLLNGNNIRWRNYPVRGVQLVGGLSFKF